MKRLRKPRVSWPPGPKLCQVKMFRKDDCPAKLASQPQPHNYTMNSSRKPRGPDLPPGFEGTHYPDKPNVSNIPLIKWKQPPKFVVNNTWLIGDGGESTERRTEDLRIAKVLKAIYPYRSSIPSGPSVSPIVEADCFDDSKTPIIRLTPIEDEWEAAEESSHTAFESSFNASKHDQLVTKLPSSIEERVSGLAPDLSVAASAALTVLMKTKEQGSKIDPDLLIKFLANPDVVKNLMNGKTGKSSETDETIPTIDTNIKPTRLVPQYVTSSPMARKPQPSIVPQEQSSTTSSSFTRPSQRRVSPPKPEYGNISQQNRINRNPVNIPMPVHSRVSIAQQPPIPARPPSSSLPMNLNLQRPQHSFSGTNVKEKPQTQHNPNSAFHTSELNNVETSIGFGMVPQTGIDTYPINLNRFDATSRPRPVVQPMKKNLDYFKNLIKEHGTDNRETNQYHKQTGKFSGLDNAKVQKQCIYFGSPRGCKMGESCIYVHDRLRPNFEAEGPIVKRVKFGKYEKNGL